MILRQTTIPEVEVVMDIIDDGKAYLKSEGIDQWQHGYPNAKTIQQDIHDGQAYVLEKNGEIIATAMISFLGEETYASIEGPGWLADVPYAVLHRVAVASDLKGQGIAAALIAKTEELCQQKGITSIRIDTHEKNASMQQLLKKTGFVYCGIIHLIPGEGSEAGIRLAFEKILS